MTVDGSQTLTVSQSQATEGSVMERQCVVRQESTNNETTMIYREGLCNPGGTPGTPQGPNPLLQCYHNIIFMQHYTFMKAPYWTYLIFLLNSLA